ncbi:MAG: fibronectin type III domain-containing protein [Saprospirales bacterium]|nr:fibronectin type III domain-containing protein [Saprospirales bacterium]
MPFASAQVKPTAGEVECFQVGNGGLFTDTGGPGGNDAVAGSAGNYINCDCITTTTLCATDGSAVKAEFTKFGINASFDWMVILDMDNPSMDQYPASILSLPSNSAFQLFSNADGAGDGGSENYGLGAQVGTALLGQMASTSFIATNPTGCLTFVFRASAQVDYSGWEAILSTTSNAPHPGNNVPCGGPVACAPPSALEVGDITETTALVTWNPSPTSTTYVLEYGPEGFLPGTGMTITVTDLTSYLLTGLDDQTTYEVYIQAICDNGDESALIGPTLFTTCCVPIPDLCNYTLNLYDSFGDGWNNAKLTVTHNGVSTVYTFTTGTFATFTFLVTEGLPLVLTYSSGSYENEVSYEMFDSDGALLHEDGPYPTVGEVYNEIVICPDCPAVNLASITITDIDTNSAQVNWDVIPSAQSYIVEYGPEGFPLGFGLTNTVLVPPSLLTGLNPCVNYDVFITAVCSPDTLSQAVGPVNFMTDPTGSGPPCIYTLNMYDSFGDGWNGSFLTVQSGGNSTNYTFTSGSFATAQIPVFANLPVVITFTGGSFLNETSYQLLDPDGNIILADGPYPQIGLVLTFIACPTCPGPSSFYPVDINADNATFAWNSALEDGQYKLEYGPLGFTQGTGTVIFTNNLKETITGLTENTYYDIYLFFTCDDDGEAGKTLGPITFKTIWYNDVGVSGIAEPTEADCNLSADQLLTFYLHNFGQYPQSLIPFNFAVNGVIIPIDFPDDGLYTGVIGNDSSEVVTFQTTYDFSVPGYYLIEVWTSLDPDSDLQNDTFRYELITAYPLPLKEDFESNVFPTGWQTTETGVFLYAPNNHNNPTYVLSDQLYSSDTNFEVTTLRVGPMGENDSLSFDYRYVNSFAGTVAATLGAGDKLEVQVSTDCGETYNTIYTINQTNHVPSTVMKKVTVDLSAFAGEAINVRFYVLRVTTAGTTYWIDLDNINVYGCPSSFFANQDVTNASAPNASDGSVKLTPVYGTSPFAYQWSNGSISPNPSGLEPGSYLVTITDAKGCSEELTVNVGYEVPSGTRDISPIGAVTLWPNPTSGVTNIMVEMPEMQDLQVQVFNSVGQLILEFSEAGSTVVTRELDLSEQAGGMYIIRLSSGSAWHFEKLVLTR